MVSSSRYDVVTGARIIWQLCSFTCCPWAGKTPAAESPHASVSLRSLCFSLALWLQRSWNSYIVQSSKAMFQERASWKFYLFLWSRLKIHVASLLILLFKRVTKVSVYPRGGDFRLYLLTRTLSKNLLACFKITRTRVWTVLILSYEVKPLPKNLLFWRKTSSSALCFWQQPRGHSHK